MFWRKKTNVELTIGCCLLDNSYSIAVISNNKELLFNQIRFFDEDALSKIPQMLADDVERMKIIAKNAVVVLLSGQYQLLLMDALNVPEAEMAKAMRWNLKGLSDYDLEDVAIDMCLVPSHEGAQHKVFVALTPMSSLNQKMAIFQTAFLNVTSVTIAEMALRNLFPLLRAKHAELEQNSFIIISVSNNIRKLHIVYQDSFYLIRELVSPQQTNDYDEKVDIENVTSEIERSVDYCMNQLDIPEPKYIFFTPAFHLISKSFPSMTAALGMDIELIDLNHYLEIHPSLPLDKQHEVFYSITGALTFEEKVMKNEPANKLS